MFFSHIVFLCLGVSYVADNHRCLSFFSVSANVPVTWDCTSVPTCMRVARICACARVHLCLRSAARLVFRIVGTNVLSAKMPQIYFVFF